MTGDKLACFPSAAPVCATFAAGADGDGDGEGPEFSSGSSGNSDAGGSLFTGVEGESAVASEEEGVAAGGDSMTLEGCSSLLLFSLGTANLQVWILHPRASILCSAPMILARRASMGTALAGPGIVQRRTEADQTKMAATETRREVK